MSLSSQLARLKKKLEEEDELLEPPASDVQIKQFVAGVRKHFDVVLPEPYLQFLREFNGLEYDGLVIFGTKDSTISPDGSPLNFIEMNQGMRLDDERFRTFVVLGTDDIGLLTYDPWKEAFQYRDRVGIDRIDKFPSFEKLLAYCFQDR